MDSIFGIPMGPAISIFPLSVVEGRLTLTAGTPINLDNVLSSSIFYFAPYKGNRLALYSGATWELYSFSELTGTVPATTSTPFDIFAYAVGKLVTLETTNWTNDTVRATALTTQDGVYVKSGEKNKRYLGTGRTLTSSGNTADSNGGIAAGGSQGKRYLWNYYNRVLRPMSVGDSTDSWTYNSVTYRSANADADNSCAFVIGVLEDPIDVTASCQIGTGVGVAGSIGIGINSTTVNSAQTVSEGATADTERILTIATYKQFPTLGGNIVYWIESARAGTATFYGDFGVPNSIQAGMNLLLSG